MELRLLKINYQLGVKNDYWVKVIPKPGFKFSKWTQLIRWWNT